MLPADFVKALGLAILIMVLDLACAYGFVSVWVLVNQPVHPLTPLDPRTITLSTLSTRIFGPILFALLIWLFQRRRPDRNAWAFGLSVLGFYLLVDWGMVAFKGILEGGSLLTAALKLLGALIGAWLASKSSRHVGSGAKHAEILD